MKLSICQYDISMWNVISSCEKCLVSLQKCLNIQKVVFWKQLETIMIILGITAFALTVNTFIISLNSNEYCGMETAMLQNNLQVLRY